MPDTSSTSAPAVPMTPDTFAIRPIEPADDAAVAGVIRAVMTEFDATGEGFSIHDPEVDHMSSAYAGPGAAYFVVTRDGRVVGGGGVAQLDGGASDVCELKKMYFLPEARGAGMGRAMLARCLEAARERGYTRCYLETMSNMRDARRLYERAGFTEIEAPMGATGHFSCDAWYVQAL
jgi:putative acetyltransferase